MRNKQSIPSTIGARNFAYSERHNEELYTSPPFIIDELIKHVELKEFVWECAAGLGHLSKRLRELGYLCFATELHHRPELTYLDDNITFEKDFLSIKEENYYTGDIVTNPPFNTSLEFITQGLRVLKPGGKMCYLLPIRYLEGKQRKKEIYDINPPKLILMFSGRVNCLMGGVENKKASSMMAFAWFIWEKGYQGDTVIKWI